MDEKEIRAYEGKRKSVSLAGERGMRGRMYGEMCGRRGKERKGTRVNLKEGCGKEGGREGMICCTKQGRESSQRV